MVAKDAARNVIDALPEDASLDDIIHALYVRAKFEHGEQDIREGRTVTHDEAKERLRK
jgi:predicted transcriptional regulator